MYCSRNGFLFVLGRTCSVQLLPRNKFVRSLSYAKEQESEKVMEDGSVDFKQLQTASLCAVSVKRKERENRISLQTVTLPKPLQEALDIVLSGYPGKQVAEDGLAMAMYLENRKVPAALDVKETGQQQPKVTRGSSWLQNNSAGTENMLPSGQLRYTRRLAVAYAASRMHANYATALRVFREISRKDALFLPRNMLDFGSGLGSAIWAGHNIWSGSLVEYLAVDISEHMGQLARVLRDGGRGWRKEDSHDNDVDDAVTDSLSGGRNIPGVFFKQYLPVSNKVQYDLVVAANSLSEIPTISARRSTLASLWRKTAGYLVLIESKLGFSVLAEARDFLLKAKDWNVVEEHCLPSEADPSSVTPATLEGHVVSPCPHDSVCPLVKMSSHPPCYYGQRVELSHCQKYTRRRHAGFFVEHFSYLVMKKGRRNGCTDQEQPSRFLEPVRKRYRHVYCHLCCPDGQYREIIFSKRKDRDLYQKAKHKQWGDVLHIPSDKMV